MEAKDPTFRNDYKIRARIRTFVLGNDFLREYVRPYVINLYRWINSYLPYPRDFILKRVQKGGRCAEIGVWRGEFSKRIYRIARPRELYLIDPWAFYEGISNDPIKKNKYTQVLQDVRHAEVVEIFKSLKAEGEVHVLRMTSEEALPQFGDSFFDFVYIDGNHEYEYVKYDIDSYYPKTKPGGIIAGDDYRLPGVRRAVDELVLRYNLEKHLVVKNDQFIITKPL